jgi:uncharacterized membrane protein
LRAFERLLAGATLLWAGAVPLAAWLRGGTAAAATLFTFLIYGVGAIVCHQRPERSFHLGALPLPVCARCTGIYAGAAAVALIALAGSRYRYSAGRVRAWLTVAAVPAVLSLCYEWATAQVPSNAVRAATGVFVGAAVAAVVLGFLDDEVRRAAGPAAER